MLHSKFSMKNLFSIFAIAAICFCSAEFAFAQCEGVYFKPTGRKITDSKILISPLQDNFAADLNGDGKLDLVATEYTTQNTYTKLFIYPGDGAGGFGTRTEINLPASLSQYYGSYLVKDFNGDNKPDITVYLTTGVLVYLNNGSGVFTPQTLTPEVGFINLVDVNNDSLKDLITGSGNSISYRLANANGSFGAAVSLPSISYIGRREGDFDTDGDMDFAAITAVNGTNYMRIAYNQGNGTFIIGSGMTLLDAGNIYSLEIKDFNNDGKPDVLVSFGSEQKVMVLLNQGNDAFSKATYDLPFGSLGDFNGDGFVDLLSYVHNRPGSSSTGYIVSLNNGAGQLVRRDYSIGGFDRYEDRPVGDFNGDGKTDFVRISNAGQSSSVVYTVFNETVFTTKLNVCNNVGQPKLIDFDRDRRTDLALWRDTDGRWRYMYNAGTSSTGIFSIFWGLSNDRPVPGDYDGDGITDTAVFRPSNGFWYVRNSSDNSTTAPQFGLATDKVVPADYNGDGRTDFAVYRPSTGIWYLQMSGSNLFYAQQFGISEDIPVPEDYDGDGKTDIAVFRPSNGFWYVSRSSDNGFYAAQWGIASDDAHPADYDGDGKADLCVRRRSNNTWYILRSYNNQPGAIQFGITEDIAQVGDWDGNSIMDLAVYRPSTRRWYSSGAGGAFLYPAFAETNEIPTATTQR